MQYTTSSTSNSGITSGVGGGPSYWYDPNGDCHYRTAANDYPLQNPNYRQVSSRLYSMDEYQQICDDLAKQSKQINEKKPMTLREKFILGLTPEPKKSFRKTGITNGDDILTDEGQRVFISWLLYSKYAEDFKKDVVDELLKDIEKSDK